MYLVHPTATVTVACVSTGQNTGKEVFECKRLSFSDLEINYYKQRHSDLEKKFIRSVLKTEINGCVKVSHRCIPHGDILCCLHLRFEPQLLALAEEKSIVAFLSVQSFGTDRHWSDVT
jgi:hypothetical protein